MALKVVSSPLSLRLSPSYFDSHFGQTELKQFKRVWKRNCVTKSQITSSPAENGNGLRVFVVSDLHTDYSENMKWVSSLSTVNHKDDVLVVAGDVSETYKNFLMAMSLLKDRFEHVFFVPGNHDLWCRRDSEVYVDSLEKLNKLLDACKSIGVQTNPLAIDNLGIIPLFSWYHESFDTEDDITSIHIPPLEMACKDYHVCKWPVGLSNGDMSLAHHFDAINNPNEAVIDDIMKRCSHIITFSHFVPRKELCPEKRMLLYPNLPKIIGSDILEHRLRTVHGPKVCPDLSCHVFGHTHFCWDSVIDGIRYVQAPLAYPRERKRSMNGGEDWLPFCIYCNGGFTGRITRRDWSDYYDSNARDPQNTEPAPWVAKYYRRRKS